MRNGREIRISIPKELYEKFKNYLKKEYRKPTEFVRQHIVDYVKECENESRGE